MLACALAARRRPGRPAAALLGAAAGIAFAGTAALIKVCARQGSAGVGNLLTHWPLYGLAAVGAVGLVLNQLAFQAGPLNASLPAITVTDPLVSVALGVWLFHEPVRHSGVALGLEAAALAVTSVAAVAVTRRADTTRPAKTISGATAPGWPARIASVPADGGGGR